MASSGQPSSSRLLAYLQLMRLPNVFTAMADVLMGFWFTHNSLAPLDVLTLLLISSSCLYTAGMVMNDVYDLEQDRRERPQRPLPSGRVSLPAARRLMMVLLVVGMAAGIAPAFLTRDQRSPAVAITLLTLIVGYNAGLKHRAIGPVVMGGCRMLNVLLGMSVSSKSWSVANWVVSGSLGVFVAGVTWFARSEASTSKRWHLVAALTTLLTGLLLLGLFPQFAPRSLPIMIWDTRPHLWALLWTILAYLIAWRFIRAVARPDPAHVQAAVKSGILSIIVLDAVVLFAVRGTGPAIAVLLLLIPTILLGRWVYST